MKNARRTFETFHKREAGVPVFPFEQMDVGEFPIPAGIPDLVCVGKAVRTCYTSDKWNKLGDPIGYYHDHGPRDGKDVFTSKNKIKFYAPRDFFPEMRRVKFPVKWPESLALLGTCDSWLVEEHPEDEDLVSGTCDEDILLCSPYGWVSRSDPTRVFLVIVEVDSGIIEGVIDGPGLRVTEAGIEG